MLDKIRTWFFRSMDDEDSVMKLRMYQTREAFSLMGLGALVGLISGLACVLLYLSVNWLTSIRQFLPIWLLVVFPTFGAILGIFIQHRLFRDTSGSGVPDVIQSVTVGRGLLSIRMLFSRLISSLLTVGTGGSAGLEGPIVVSGAAAGSLVSRIFSLSEGRRSLLIACGTSGAIGGIFNAPLTGLIFSLEVILGEWKAKNLVPTVTSAAVATHLTREFLGDKIHFPHDTFLPSSYDLFAFGVLGISCAFMGTLLMRVLEFGTWSFSKLKIAASLRAGLGALGVGVIALAIPQVTGEGYDLIQGYLLNQSSIPLVLVFGVMLLRILTTTLTLGSGGAGGIFAPSLFLGSSLGLLFGSVLESFSSWFARPGAYALGGMAGVVAAVMVAPLTGIFLVLEISGSYDLILPLMICVLTAFMCSRLLNTGSIYTRDLISSGLYKARGSQELILSEAEWDELLTPAPFLDESLSLAEFQSMEWPDRQTIFAVKNESGIFRGCFDLAEVQTYLKDPDMLHLVTLSQVIHETGYLTKGQTPDECLVFFSQMDVNFVPVLDGETFLGIVTKEKIFDFIRRETLILEDQ